MHETISRDFFPTPSRKGTWNFSRGFSEVSCISSSRFVIVTSLVLELRALGFLLQVHVYVTVFRGFFYTLSHIGTWNFPCGFSEVSYISTSRFVVLTSLVLELRALGYFTMGHMHATCHFPWGFSEVNYISS
jgi:hypothetical protein